MCKYISFKEYDENVKKVYLPNNSRDKSSVHFDKKHGDITINYFSTGLGITYSSFHGNFPEDTVIEGFNTSEFSFLSFNLGSNMYMEDSSKRNNLNFDSNTCLCGNIHQDYKSNSFYCKNKSYLAHYITIDSSLFNEIINKDDIKQILTGDSFSINSNNMVTIKQRQLLDELSKTTLLEGKLQELYLESKLLDLVYTTINNEHTQKKQEDTIYLNSKDVECLKKAKKILIENMTNPPSLKELSYKCAINEFKLKKGFKQLFGNTVYGFLQEYRLIEAKRLLETNEVNINEATFLVGYKSVSHFSRIFKEHFGKNPIEIKKESRKYYY